MAGNVLAQIGACVEIADARGEGCKEREGYKARVQNRRGKWGRNVIVPGIRSQGVCKRLTAGYLQLMRQLAVGGCSLVKLVCSEQPCKNTHIRDLT